MLRQIVLKLEPRRTLCISAYNSFEVLPGSVLHKENYSYIYYIYIYISAYEIGRGWLPEMNSSFTEPPLSYIVKIGMKR